MIICHVIYGTLCLCITSGTLKSPTICLGQQKRHEDGIGWGVILHRKLAAYWYKVFCIKDRVDREVLSTVYCPTHLMLADYFTKPLQGWLFHKSGYIIMVRVSPLTLLEHKFSYTSRERFGKHIPSKEIPSGTGKPLKETKDMLKDENNKHVRTRTWVPLKKKQMLREKNDKQVSTSMWEPLKKKEMFRDEKGK